MATSESTSATREDGPVLSLINKRLRAHKKKLNRISQMEDAISQGKPINKEQEEVLKSKPSLLASIDELEKLRAPLLSSLSEELSLAQSQSQPHPEPHHPQPPTVYSDAVLEDLLNLLYFASLFDVKSQGDFTATMLTRTHERGCCLTYDYVTDDATDLLGERDLDLISGLGSLLISRPVDSGLSHKNALRRCVERAKLWLSNSHQRIDHNSNVSYAGLREKLNKIMASDYFTTTPEMKGTVEMAAAAAGNYAQFQVPVHGVPISVPVLVEGSDVGHYQQEEEDAAENFQEHAASDSQSSHAEELEKGEGETKNNGEAFSGELETAKQPAEVDHVQKEFEPKEQYNNSRRNYQNHRGGRGGGGSGRRGYPNGRGGRIGGRGSGGYQNGRGQYYDQPRNYYPKNYYNNRGRDGRGSGHPCNNHGSAVHGGHAPADVGVTS